MHTSAPSPFPSSTFSSSTFSSSVITRRRALAGALAALVAADATARDSAPAYPSGVIRIVVPTSAGGSVDSTGRLLAEALAKPLAAKIVVENKAGAGGLIGIDSVIKEPGRRPHAGPGHCSHAVGAARRAQPAAL